MKKKDRALSLFWLAFIIVSLAVIWLVQRNIPFMMDDLWYSTLLYSEEPITSFGDIVSAQIWHYMNWGGRSVTHTMLQVILCMGEFAADLLNTGAMLLLSFLICAIAGKKELPYIGMTLGLLHAFNANWKMSMYWQAGACNYLYITIFILLFLICYLRMLGEEDKKPFWGISVFIIPLGICCGWSNENMGPTLWLLTLGIMVWRYRKKRKVYPWMILGNLSCLLGSIVMIAAPGNYVRLQEVASNSYGLLWKLFLRGYYESHAIADYLFLPLILTAVVTIVNLLILGNKLSRAEIVLLAGAVLSWGAMELSPHYPDRASFGTMVFLCCAMLSQVKRILEKKATLGMRRAVTCIGLLLWLKGMYYLGEFMAIQWGWIK